MASGQDDVLAVSEHSSGEFSGFSPVSEDEVLRKKKKKTKSKEKASSSKTKHKKGKSKKDGGTNDVRPNAGFDFGSLGPEDIVKLRGLLGIHPQTTCDEDSDYNLDTPLDKLPRMTVHIDSNDISGDESPVKPKKISSGLAQALFEDSDNCEQDEWDLPKLKTPEKGSAIASSLANVINTSCTTQCETDSLLNKYKVPLNCEMLAPPLVNSEIWKIMDRRVQSQDRGIVETQNLIAASMIPIIKLAEVMKPHIMANSTAKTLVTDALTLIGQVQFNLSVRRRYMIRPVLKKKYHTLCNISMPVTTKLFGDDVAKDIKSCDSLTSLGKDQYPNNYQRSYQSRGRGYSKRGSYNNYQNSGRYQPYPNNRGQQKTWNKNYRIPKKSATSTSTAPNDQNL